MRMGLQARCTRLQAERRAEAPAAARQCLQPDGSKLAREAWRRRETHLRTERLDCCEHLP